MGIEINDASNFTGHPCWYWGVSESPHPHWKPCSAQEVAALPWAGPFSVKATSAERQWSSVC